MFLNINGFSQEIYNDVFLSNDSIIKNEILTNKKFSFKQIISISDNNGNILIFNNNRGVKIFNKKKRRNLFLELIKNLRIRFQICFLLNFYQ